MNFLLTLLLFGSFFANADFQADKKTAAIKWYNQGVKHYNSQEKIKATADFRKALQLDAWLWPAQKALNQLQHPPPFWMLIPSEVFFSLIVISLAGLFFSLSAGRFIFFFLCLVLHFSFAFYRQIPRLTILKETPAHTAPHSSSPVLFSLEPGAWILQLKTSKNWIQIKTSEQSIGWILKNESAEK